MYPQSLDARPLAIIPPDTILPEIMFRHVSTSPTAANTNYLEFWLEWPDPGTTIYHNPPDPIAVGQNQQPRWIYFWKFGDQTYSGESMPRHIFPPAPVDSFEVEVSLKPIYSDDHDPFKKKKKKKVGIPPPSPTGATAVPVYADMPYTSYSMISSPDSALEMKANWGATRPGKGVTIALTYRPRSNSKEPVSGVIGLLYAKGFLEVDHVEGAPDAGSEVAVRPEFRTPEALSGRIWRFEDLSPSAREQTIFVDVRVPDAIGQLINDTSTVQCPIFAFIAYDDQQGGNSPNQQTSFLNNLFGISKFDSQGEVGAGVEGDVTDSYNFYQEKTSQLAINWASDPNYILVNPAMLPPGSSELMLNYELHFQNDGAASATKMQVRMGMDPLLHGAGALSVPAANVPNCFTFAAGADSLRWNTPNPPPAGCKLNGAGDAVALGFSTDLTWGQTLYSVQTRPGYTLRIGDTIRAQGKVYMDGTREITPVSVVPVGTPAFCYPGILGLKYTQHFANEAVRSGWGLGLTLRYALGKVQNPNFEAHSLRRIRKNNFPLFWWQGELGYGQTSLQPNSDSLRLCHLDVTPVMLRFIARKPPLRFGNLAFERGWGISAGYTASYLLASRRNGADDTAFDEFGFGDRLDHSISVSADFLNLIGRPGISVGAGWRWRNSGITGTREWYQNAFVYLHYTFSPRFRTEFGWLN